MNNMVKRFTVRAGLQKDLPILEVSEPAFCIDSLRPYIGSDEGNIELMTLNKFESLTERSILGIKLGSSEAILALDDEKEVVMPLASLENDGLMSVEDKKKLDYLATPRRELEYSLDSSGFVNVEGVRRLTEDNKQGLFQVIIDAEYGEKDVYYESCVFYNTGTNVEKCLISGRTNNGKDLPIFLKIDNGNLDISYIGAPESTQFNKFNLKIFSI